MNLDAFFKAEFEEHVATVARTQADLEAPFAAMFQSWLRCVRGGGKIMLFGNGGSAGDSQHLATELTVRYNKDRRPIAALALTTDTSALTAAGNDIGFENVFARQIEALGKPGDLALGISTSGRSPNVLAGLKMARSMGIATAALGGGTGGSLAEFADVTLIVPSGTTARIQEMHILLGQMLCGALELELGLVQP